MDLKEKKDILSLFRNLVVIIAIYLYFIGWVYINAHYTYFGIDLHSLDIPFLYFLIYASYALGHALSSTRLELCIVVVLTIFVFVASFYSKLWQWTIVKIAVAVIPIVFFLPLYFMAKKCGRVAAELKVSGRSPTVTFVLSEDLLRRIDSEFLEANRDRDLKLVTHTKDRIYVFRKQNDNQDQSSFCTYDLSKGDIYVTTIEAAE